MGYVVLIAVVIGLGALAFWDHRTRRRGHTLRRDGMSGIQATRRRDFRTGPSSSLAGVPIIRIAPPPEPPEDENRLRR